MTLQRTNNVVEGAFRMALEVVAGREAGPLPEAPYPADTRAKGMDFRLDVERLRSSDTWALAPVDLRPWLLMLWVESWIQTPAGSLPDDDELIAAKVGMPLSMLQTHRRILLRGWRRHADGRLYHATISALVLDIVLWRQAEKDRKAKWRAEHNQRLKQKSRPSPASVPRDGRTPEPEPEPEPEPKATTKTKVNTSTRAEAKNLRGSRMAEDATMPDDWRAWTVEAYGVTPQKATMLFIEFRDYWADVPGARGLKVRWFGTFKNRLRVLAGDGKL